MATKGLLTFTDALELEHLRLIDGISSNERDELLLNFGVSIPALDPSRFVFVRDENSQSIFLEFYPFLFAKQMRAHTHTHTHTLSLFLSRPPLSFSLSISRSLSV